MRSHRKSTVRVVLLVLLALLAAAPADAQVGGPPTPPVTLWNFLGIPQGIRKLQGATRNRNGNRPNREPKPPLKAIADPANLESSDPSIKKAAEIKQAEDLKKQKIKAVKYLASIGCGCYDIDGGVTKALVASMSDCTEDVRYETINAIAEAAQGGCCANCGSTCCCNKEILTAMARIAYERDEHGCYVEPSERVRQAAAEALRICCPNNSPPVIVAPEQQQEQERETAEEIEEGDSRETAPVDPNAPPPPVSTPPADLPEPPTAGGAAVYETPEYSVAPVAPGIPAASHQPINEEMVAPAGAMGMPVYGVEPPVASPADAAPVISDEYGVEAASTSVTQVYGYGVIVDVSPAHGMALVRFDHSDALAAVGSEIGVYKQVGDVRRLVARLEVVQALPGSANVAGTPEALQAIVRGDMVLRAMEMTAAEQEAMVVVPAADAPAHAEASAPAAAPPVAPIAEPVVTAESELVVRSGVVQASELRPVDRARTGTQPAAPVRRSIARRPVGATFMR